ncbi:MAG: phospholipase D-like domain-containing protein [Flavobacteriaceae bacterium]
MEQHVYFKNIREEIINLLESAQNEILIAVAWFTDAKIIDILNKVRKRGIVIQILFYDDKVNNKNLFEQLYYNFADIRVSKKLMHNKFCIIDNRIIINGSYNWTLNASSNNENIQVSINNPSLVSKFKEEFYELQGKCTRIDNFFKYSNDVIDELERDFSYYYEYRKEKINFPYFKKIKDLEINEIHKNVKLKENEYVLITNREEQYNLYRYLFYLRRDYLLSEISKITQIKFQPPKTQYPFIVNIAKQDDIIPATNDFYIINNHNKVLYKIDNKGKIIKDVIYPKIYSDQYFVANGIYLYYYKTFEKVPIEGSFQDLILEKGLVLSRYYSYDGTFRYGFTDFNGKILVKFIYINYKIIDENQIEFYELPACYSCYSSKYDVYLVESYSSFHYKDFSSKSTCYKVHIFNPKTGKINVINEIRNKVPNTEYFFDSDENYDYATYYRYCGYSGIELEKFKKLRRELLFKSEQEKENLSKFYSRVFNYRANKEKEEQQKKEQDKNCYIATMVYNDIYHPNVERLRNFRDEVLLLNTFGKIFVKYYYKISPWIVEKFGKYKLLHIIAKSIIEKIILNHIKSKY